ncbi:MAG: carbohydrate porin, partial [Candidatus Hydrogenedentota bacterium]
MKGFARQFTVVTTALAVTLLATRGYADVPDTLEKQLEELRRMLIQLQKVVEKQEQKLEEQEQVIRSLRQQMGSPETAQALIPHLDKHLLHERSGMGEQLGRLSVGVGLTGVVQGSIDGEDVSGESRDQTDASWSMDLELEAPIGERGLAFMLIEAGQGEGLTDELANVFHTVNDDAGNSESALEVTEAWYEHNFWDDRVVLTAGKLDLTNYFDTNMVANDETVQFLNSGLVNSVAVAFPEDNGAGVRLGIHPADWVEVGVGWAESDADWEDIVNDGFGIAEVNLKPGFRGRAGNYRFYAWVNGSDKEELDGDKTDEDGWGIGLSFDQNISDSLTVFLRLGYEDDDVYEV